GVSEETGVGPFVCESYKYKDGTVKPGTFAIMANGDVRFIPKDIPKDVFLKMCSITQAEKIDNLDDYAVLVPAPEVKVKPALPPVPPEAKSPPEQRNPDPPKGGNAGGGTDAKVVSILTEHCAQCHTGTRAKGKNMIFNEGGTLNPNLRKDAMAQALAEGKMP